MIGDMLRFAWLRINEREQALLAGRLADQQDAIAEIRALWGMLGSIGVLRTPIPTPTELPAAARAIKVEVEAAEERAAEHFLRLLCLRFETHPDYRPEWSPNDDR